MAEGRNETTPKTLLWCRICLHCLWDDGKWHRLKPKNAETRRFKGTVCPHCEAKEATARG